VFLTEKNQFTRVICLRIRVLRGVCVCCTFPARTKMHVIVCLV